MTSDPSSGRRRRHAVADYFSREAGSWRDRYQERSFDAYNYQARARVAAAWLRQLHSPDANRLLDLGCGAGVQAAAAAHTGWQVCGVDIAHEMLARAAKDLPGPHWLSATVDSLPFRPGTFDVVMMLGVIGYVPDPLEALATVRRLVRPGGHLVISWATQPPLLLDGLGRIVSAVPDAAYLRAKALVTGKPIPRKADGRSFYREYNRFWTEADFLGLLRSGGYAVLGVRGVNYGRFRFAGKRLWPESVDIALSRTVDMISAPRPLAPIRRWARTHIALARVPGP